MSPRVKPVPTCPECGGQIQATVKVYLSIDESGEWEHAFRPDADGVDPYCENDHAIGSRRVLRDQAAEMVADEIERGAA